MARLIVAAVLLLAVTAFVTVDARVPRHDNNRVIEYDVSGSQVSILVPIHRSTGAQHKTELFTYPGNVKVGKFLTRGAAVRLQDKVGAKNCDMKKNGKSIPDSATVAEILDDNGVTLTCSNMVFTFAATSAPEQNDMKHTSNKAPVTRKEAEQLVAEIKRLEAEEAKAAGSKVAHRFAERFSIIPKKLKDIAKAVVTKVSNIKKAVDTGYTDYPNDEVTLSGGTVEGLNEYIVGFAKTHFGKLHPYDTWKSPSNGVIKVANSFTVGLAADWGSGTKSSDVVGKLIASQKPTYTLHLGDVYYMGTPEEVKSNFLGIAPKGIKHGVKWPHGSKGSFSLMGNHEMYSRGYGYFDTLLPTMKLVDVLNVQHTQEAAFFALENDYWRIIGVDSGYTTYLTTGKDNTNYLLRDEVIDWLKNKVKLGNPADKRGLIFMSHHQPVSGFDPIFSPTPVATQLAKILASAKMSDRTFLWLFGHEHRLNFYEKKTFNYGGYKMNLVSRCVGNSGFPPLVQVLPQFARDAALKLYDDRLWNIQSGTGIRKVGYNGWSKMTFNNDQLRIDYYSTETLKNDPKTLSSTSYKTLVTETFTIDRSTGTIKEGQFTVVDKDMTYVNHI